MTKETSLYLDFMRILAALAVYLSHEKREAITYGFLKPLSVFGEDGVVLFFVISGVVIAHVVTVKERGVFPYFIARFARLWSVAIPAVILTVALDLIGSHIAPALYSGAQGLPPMWKFDLPSLGHAVAPLLFANKLGAWSVEVGTNAPFWSLCYEFWYYVAFGLFCFSSGWKRLAVLVIFAALVGTRILEMSPIWILGVALYHAIQQRGSDSIFHWILWPLSGGGMVALLAMKYRIATLLPSFIDNSLCEYNTLAIIFSINIYAFSKISYRFAGIFNMLSSFIRGAARRTFSLYLYHVPLLFFFGAITYNMSSREGRIAIVNGGTLISVVLLAQFTELKKEKLSYWLRRVVFFRSGMRENPSVEAP